MKIHLRFLGHIIRKEILENLIVTGQTEDNTDRGKLRITYLVSLSQCMVDNGLKGNNRKTKFITAKSGRNLRKAMIT